MNGKEWLKKGTQALERYKYVLLVLLAGVLLLLWPGQDSAGPACDTAQAGEDTLYDTQQLERRLEKALSQVEGAGQVTVVLTLDGGPRRILAQDGSAGQENRETSVVLASRGSGGQEAVELQRLSPVYRGALVVSSGADDPQVRLALSQAVASLTGLGADKISICKGG